jgi:Holliday junction resolvase
MGRPEETVQSEESRAASANLQMNSREKGKRGERQWRDELRAQGYAARRGQQFSGSPDSPDVVSEDLPWIHFEVKAVERLNIEDAMDQSRRDSAEKIPIVAHRRNFRPWLVTMTAEVFFKFLRGILPPEASNNTKTKTNEQQNENQSE